MTAKYKPSAKTNLITFGFLFSVPIVLIPILSAFGSGGIIALIAAGFITIAVLKVLFWVFTGEFT